MNLSQLLHINSKHKVLVIYTEPVEAVSVLRSYVTDVLGIPILGNPDYVEIVKDSFSVDDSRLVSDVDIRKSVGDTRVFVIVGDVIQYPAQSALLKVIEEPHGNTFFFIVVPPGHDLIEPLLSRSIVIHHEESNLSPDAVSFVNSSLKDRLAIVKKLSSEDDDAPERRKNLLKFLRDVEQVLYRGGISGNLVHVFDAITFARKTITSGSVIKNALEHVAISIPNNLKNDFTPTSALW